MLHTLQDHSPSHNTKLTNHVATHLSPETFSSIRFTTPLPKTKLANIVNSPAMPACVCVNEGGRKRKGKKGGREEGEEGREEKEKRGNETSKNQLITCQGL